MALFQKILLWLVYAVVGLAIIGLLLPDTAKVERSVTIARPAAVVFSQVDRMANFNKWSPWYALEPTADYQLSGPAAGVGSRLDWKGEKVGSGSQTIQESVPYERIVTMIDFGPMGKATATMLFEQQGAQTKATWAFLQKLSFNPIDRYMGLLTPNFVGKDYEKGLAKLKIVAEALPAADFGATKITFDTVKPQPFAFVAGTSSAEMSAANRALQSSFAAVVDGIVARGVKPGGYPIAVTLKHDGQSYQFQAGWPYLGKPGLARVGRVVFGESPGGFVMRANHPGTAKTVAQTYAGLEAAAAAYGFERNGNPWEVYLDNPSQMSVGDMRVAVLMPVQ
jgi:uncharacterized protein YndB with AHSA1/START domain/effector-binding domain-containing protein